MLVSGMQGLGDNIYQRSILREIKERVYLRTSWPEMYRDLPNIFPVKPNTRLRTQKKNVDRQSNTRWYACPSLPMWKIRYGVHDLRRRSILESMTKYMGGVEPKIFDLPECQGPEVPGPYVVVRPVTVRAEWANHARSPEACYVAKASQMARDKGYHVVSVADLEPGKEWAEEIPYYDTAYHKGELDIEGLMGLVLGASAVIGGVGWIVPAVIAAGVPLICILGGLGMFNAPEKICSAPMDLSKTYWVYPDNFCMCEDMAHVCDKHISDFEQKMEQCLSKI